MESVYSLVKVSIKMEEEDKHVRMNSIGGTDFIIIYISVMLGKLIKDQESIVLGADQKTNKDGGLWPGECSNYR